MFPITGRKQRTVDMFLMNLYYKQSAIVFCILCAVFMVIGLSLLLHNDKLFLLEIPLVAGVIIYAIVSTLLINKRTKE